MKKVTITIAAAIIFNGDYKETKAAAESCASGASDSFDEEQSKNDTHLTFTDDEGTERQAHVGDAMVPCKNEDGSFKGFTHLVKDDLGTWSVEDVDAPAATDETTQNTGSGAAGTAEGAE